MGDGKKAMISAGIFDTQFKNILRDCYSYGFKEEEDFILRGGFKSQYTSKGAQERIRNIFSDFQSWEKQGENSAFISFDSQEMESNPFHRLYRFCGFSSRDLVYFFNTVFLLSDEFEIRERVLEELEQRARGAKGTPYILALRDHLREKRPLSSSEINCFCVYEKYMPVFAGENRTLNNRLLKYSELGLLKRIQRKEKGNNRWMLNGLTMKKILERGTACQEDFKDRFHYALDFFSQYFPMGEIGTFLLERMGEQPIRFLRFKHDYFMQAMNDFNLTDLLFAMESRKWCRIQYRHGIRGGDAEILCCPLQIRISLQNGRESLMYYEPFTRNCTSLRLDFIDRIEYIEETDIYKFWKEEGVAESRLQSDIKRSCKLLEELWGVSVRAVPKGNVAGNASLKKITLHISYNSETEAYIKERILREKRIGRVREGENELTFEVKVSDPLELKPWLRSFYKRLLKAEGMKEEGFSVEEDAGRILKRLEGEELRLPESAEEEEKREGWGIPAAFKENIDKIAVKAAEHDRIFNEMYNGIVGLYAELLIRLFQKECLTEVQIREEINKAVRRPGRKMESILDKKQRQSVFEFLISSEFLIPDKKRTGGRKGEEIEYIPRFKIKEGKSLFRTKIVEGERTFYKEIFPLLLMEQRWLLNMLSDSRIQFFLTKDEVRALYGLIQEESLEKTRKAQEKILEGECAQARTMLAEAKETMLQPLPFERIKYFDRFAFSRENMEKEKKILISLYGAVSKKRRMRIKYRTRRGELWHRDFEPVILEFSRRNQRFQVYMRSCENGKICILNLAQILQAEILAENFDDQEASEAYLAFREENAEQIEIQFTERKNTPDRILTEFSPWKKTCSYDRENGIYTMTLHYQRQDKKELVIRLLGYGEAIYIPNKSHPVCQEIRSRVETQMKLIK